jgi:hypothetical protein
MKIATAELAAGFVEAEEPLALDTGHAGDEPGAR